MASKERTLFFCSQCGSESRRWVGRCPACGEWNTMVEQPDTKTTAKGRQSVKGSEVKRLRDVEDETRSGITTGIGELDRVLGGSLVDGSLVLIGGDPGIGKSTLLLQAAHHMAKEDQSVLYVSGEESARQVALRAKRIGANSEHLMVLCDTDAQRIIAKADALKPKAMVIDSIQTMYRGDMQSAPGSVSQVRESAALFMRYAKETGCSILLVGHVTKSGAIAGPRVLEHMVDTVLYFEGGVDYAYRILRAVKNRFGSTNEIGVFEMREEGMREVPNPSEILLAQRSISAPGSAVTISMEGSRPVLVEVQSLVSQSAFAAPRRQAAGVDYNRLVLLLAVLEKRAGLVLYNQDVYVNVAGGLKLMEPAVDLGLCMAVASGFKDMAIENGTALFGEVGLTGEIRPVGSSEQRIAEARRAGFERIILPMRSIKGLKVPDGIELVGVDTLSQALNKVF